MNKISNYVIHCLFPTGSSLNSDDYLCHYYVILQIDFAYYGFKWEWCTLPEVVISTITSVKGKKISTIVKR